MSIVSALLNKMPKSFSPVVLFFGRIFLPHRLYLVLQWKLLDGDNTLRINYPLKSSSVVFDLGGYEGDWSKAIYEKYQPNIYIFEPIKEYAANIENRFKNLKKIYIFPFGLSSKNKTISLHLSKNETSEFGMSEKVVRAKLIDAKEFMKKYNIRYIDVAKLNIEGGEYDLLEYLIKENLVRKFKNIQVQFHAFVPNADIRAKKIQNELKKTHKLVYQFPFVWESWKLKTTSN